MLTIPIHEFMPWLPPGVSYIRGQAEEGTGGFRHWQVLVIFSRDVRLRTVRETFGSFHAELSRSKCADEYVWKEDTSISNTRFELGKKPQRRNSKRDWDQVWDCAIKGEFTSIDRSVLVCHYNSIKRIHQDHLRPVGMERVIYVYWGDTGAGKSRRAWDEAGDCAYPKDPNTKFWCGYQGQENVVCDEYRGNISISNLLRWFDRYPCIVEVKGSATVLVAKKIWITSNLHPNDWYPDLDQATKDALLRRLTITHFSMPFGQ